MISAGMVWLRRAAGESSFLSWTCEKGGERHPRTFDTTQWWCIRAGNEIHIPQNQTVGQLRQLPQYWAHWFSFFVYEFSVNWVGRTGLDWGKRRPGVKGQLHFEISHVWDKGPHHHLLNESRERTDGSVLTSVKNIDWECNLTSTYWYEITVI